MFAFMNFWLMGLLRGGRGGFEGSVGSNGPCNGLPRNLSDMFFFFEISTFGAHSKVCCEVGCGLRVAHLV